VTASGFIPASSPLELHIPVQLTASTGQPKSPPPAPGPLPAPSPGTVRRPPAYGLAQLRDDLQRFVFLLGGSDGEALFGPDTAQ
jgi:hypothetical protein